MVDNLMFLKCKICGEKICLAKYYSMEWFLHKTIDEYNNFLSKHKECCGQTDNVLTGGQIYDIEYDNKD